MTVLCWWHAACSRPGARGELCSTAHVLATNCCISNPPCCCHSFLHRPRSSSKISQQPCAGHKAHLRRSWLLQLQCMTACRLLRLLGRSLLWGALTKERKQNPEPEQQSPSPASTSCRMPAPHMYTCTGWPSWHKTGKPSGTTPCAPRSRAQRGWGQSPPPTVQQAWPLRRSKWCTSAMCDRGELLSGRGFPPLS